MHDTVEVYFNCFKNPINVSSILADFTLFGHEFTIRWYGAIIAFGFLLAVLFGGRMAYKWKMSIDKMLDVLIYGTIFGIIGARLYYCVFKWDMYKDNLAEIIQIWNGGLAIYGGIIGGLAAAYIVCKVRKMNFWNLLDLAGMSLLIGQGIGRCAWFMRWRAGHPVRRQRHALSAGHRRRDGLPAAFERAARLRGGTAPSLCRSAFSA